MKRRINTSTLLGNWKTVEHEGDNNTNHDWCFWYSHRRINKVTGGVENKRTSGRPSKLLHYWEWPEYWEKSWRLKETCFHSVSGERPSANTDVKNSQGVIIMIIIKLKNLWSTTVTVIPIVIGALSSVTKGLLKGLKD